MDNLLYKNAVYFKNEILPYTFILELKEEVMIIKIDEYDFAHLVGKQYCKNLLISKLGQKEFFEKVLSSKITYNNLIDFNKSLYEKEYNWIQNKNNTFIIAFETFMNDTNLKVYKTSESEVYTKLKIDYFHQNVEENNILILGIIGSSIKNTFLFNTILSNDPTLMKRFDNNKKIKVIKLHKILNKDLKNKLLEIDKSIKKSERNINAKQNKKIKKNNMSKEDIKEINKLLNNSLKVYRGANGRKSLRIEKDGIIVEKGIRIFLDKLNTNRKIAEYINDNYK